MELKKLLAQSLSWRGLYFCSLLLVNVFLARYLQASVAGNIYFLTSIFSFIQIVASLSLEAGITFFASGKLIRSNKLLWLSISWSSLVGLVVLSCSVIYFHFIYPVDISLQVMYGFFVVSYVMGMLLTNNSTVLFYTQDNFVLPNLLLLITNIIFVFLIPKHEVISDDMYTEKILYTYFFLFLFQGFLLSAAFAIKNKSFKEFSLPSKKDNTTLFRYSLISLAASLVFFLVYRIDYYFVHISPVCTDADLGNYIQVSKIGQLLLVIPQIIASVVFPRSASGHMREELNTALMIIARLLLQFFLLLFIVIFFMGDWLFPAVFGSTFNKMNLPFLILLPGIFALSVLALLSAYFSGKGNVRVNLEGAIIALIFVLAGDYFLVPYYGIVAAAGISTVGYCINLAYSLRQFYKDYSVNLVEFFRWRKTDYHWLKSLLTRNNS